jgi:hypothetical protein
MIPKTTENYLFRAITPLLIVIVGFLVKSKLEEIAGRMASIESILIEQGRTELRLNRLEKDVEGLKSHSAMIHWLNPEALIEKEITFQNLIKYTI